MLLNPDQSQVRFLKNRLTDVHEFEQRNIIDPLIDKKFSRKPLFPWPSSASEVLYVKVTNDGTKIWERLKISLHIFYQLGQMPGMDHVYQRFHDW